MVQPAGCLLVDLAQDGKIHFINATKNVHGRAVAMA
jgi:hypothetical protein